MRNIKLYLSLVRVAILGKIQYKADFLIGVISIFILNSVNLSLIWILVSNFDSLNGWGMFDLLFLYSLWMLSRSLYGIFFWHVTDLEELIVTGNFDSYLVRPIRPSLQLLGKDINYSGAGDFLVGLVGFIIAWFNLGLSWNFMLWVYFIGCIISGTLIQLAINWIVSTLSFWTVRSRTISSITERFTVLMQQYPVSIFGKWFQVFVTCFLPVAFINYYPSVVFLDKFEDGIQIWQYLSPVVAVLLLALAVLVWSRGVKRYSGTGN